MARYEYELQTRRNSKEWESDVIVETKAQAWSLAQQYLNYPNPFEVRLRRREVKTWSKPERVNREPTRRNQTR